VQGPPRAATTKRKKKGPTEAPFSPRDEASISGDVAGSLKREKFQKGQKILTEEIHVEKLYQSHTKEEILIAR